MSLFDDNENYTDDARELDYEASKVLQPIVDKYAKKGYKTREIQDILFRSVLLTCGRVRVKKIMKKKENG